MAKQTNGYLDGFRGKLGPAVGYMWNGKWCVRSHQPQPFNPRTEAQTLHRTLFKQEVQLAAHMRWAVTTTFTALARENSMTSYNLFVKVNQHAFSLLDGQLQVDYSRLCLSIGDVPVVEVQNTSQHHDNVLDISFQRGIGKGFDQVQAYIYVPALEKGFLSAPVYRRDKHINVALPDDFAGHTAHIYLMAQSEDDRWSDSTYAGIIVLTPTCPSMPSLPSLMRQGGMLVDEDNTDFKDLKDPKDPNDSTITKNIQDPWQQNHELARPTHENGEP